MTSRMTFDHEPRPLPDETLAPRVIVCERAGTWAVALRAALTRLPQARQSEVSETRSLAECWSELTHRPSSFVVVELNATNVDAVVDHVVRLERRFPLARVAVVAERALADYESLVREAGAVHFTTSPRECDRLARAAARHLAQAAQPRRGMAESIWAGLPWGGRVES